MVPNFLCEKNCWIAYTYVTTYLGSNKNVGMKDFRDTRGSTPIDKGGPPYYPTNIIQLFAPNFKW